MKFPRKFIFFVFVSFLFCIFSKTSFAAEDYRTDYQVEYNLSNNQNSINTQVKFNVKVTNKRTEVYVKKFSINFPKSFGISNLSASDDKGPISVNSSTDDQKINLEMEFSDPNTGRDSVNNFYLTFSQDNLFKVNGNIWEVIIPTIENKNNGDYQVIVNLPENSDKKISLSKPRPTAVSGRQIVWTNTPSRTIYAVFGDKQYYQTELVYHLKNPKIAPVYTEIAFPPDTLYQKNYVISVDPIPAATYTDEDGNFIGKYYLGPQETKNITYKTLIEVSTSPREEIIPVFNNKIESQKKYLLTQQKIWEIPENAIMPKITTVDQVYYYVVNSLSYNFKNVGKNKQRLNVKEILKNPTQAVCLEFADLFVAMAREKGFYAREIEGYGFSHEETFRPISLTGDILHAWPEYYDSKLQVWKQVDPTWENTSGIDYFSSFDLNHITFAIHGKDPEYPVPAGMYKLDKSEDITINTLAEAIKENKLIAVEEIDLTNEIEDAKQYSLKITITNTGNVFLYNTPIKITSDSLQFDQSDLTIEEIAPYEKKVLTVNYSSKEKNKVKTTKVSINLDERDYSETVKIIPYYYALVKKMCVVLLLFCAGFLMVKWSLRKHDHTPRT